MKTKTITLALSESQAECLQEFLCRMIEEGYAKAKVRNDARELDLFHAFGAIHAKLRVEQ